MLEMKTLKIIAAILFYLGAFVVIGTVGSGDLEIIGINQILMQILLGFILVIGGIILWDICV